MTQPCLPHELRGRGAVKTGRKEHGWHRMQNVGTAMRTCNGTCSVPGQNVCSCRVFLDQQHPAGQKLRVAAALLVFHLALGASELIKKAFQKETEIISEKPGGVYCGFFPSQALSAMH